ncbi:hypothetical protein DLM_1339 [Aquitalea magnusonii]|uniref:Uncharacterized protein n=1 Tax=Aquitalea magnusonii TaxID=332411 RepID=A0A3G9GDT3_9NEIS|nr:hypothetical protein DLM_1339 [Aquitalea magnusonii]
MAKVPASSELEYKNSTVGKSRVSMGIYFAAELHKTKHSGI